MAFLHQIAPGVLPAPKDECFVFQGDKLLLQQGDGEPRLVTQESLSSWAAPKETPMHLGLIDGHHSWTLEAQAEAQAPQGTQWAEARPLLSLFDASRLQALSCAKELLFWRGRTRFCGCCGTPLVDAETERARRCPRCSAMFFPSQSAAIIVAITRGDEILLAHNRNFRANFFSVLAGFVDPGENLEQAVHREVLEEVGIEIEDLRYRASQPWPFPNSLMLGFRARYKAGELRVDGKELHEAGWFSRKALPEIPKPGSVAHTLIDEWLRE